MCAFRCSFLCVCVIRLCVYFYVCVYVYVCAFRCACLCVCEFRLCVYVCVFLSVCVYVCVYFYVSLCVCGVFFNKYLFTTCSITG